MLLRGLFLPLLLLSLLGCSAIQRVFSPPPTIGQKVSHIAGEVTHASNGLGMLSWVGGIATLAGIAALVITGGRMGLRAIVIGVCLCVLNFIVANFASWVLVPVLFATGLISVAWGYVTVKQVLKDKEN